MENQNLIRNFLELLDQSGLPDDRKQYWLARIGSENSNPEDELLFTQELESHLRTLDDAIDFTDAQIAADSAKIRKLDSEALPYLQRLAADQPGYYEQEGTRYKKEVLAAEKQMMTDVEGIRGEKQAMDIDAIRKKLLS